MQSDVLERSQTDPVKYTRVYYVFVSTVLSDPVNRNGDGSLSPCLAQPYKQLDPTLFETQMNALCDSLEAADLSLATKLSGMDSLCDMFEKLHLV